MKTFFTRSSPLYPSRWTHLSGSREGWRPIEIESWRTFLPKKNIFSHRIVFLPALRTRRSSVCRSSPSRAGRSTPRLSPTATLASGGPDIHHARLPTPVSVIPRRLLQFSDPLLGASLRPPSTAMEELHGFSLNIWITRHMGSPAVASPVSMAPAGVRSSLKFTILTPPAAYFVASRL